MTDEEAAPRPWVPALLGVLFYGWMYGTPLLLLLGLATRTSSWAEEYRAGAYARTTVYFVAGLVLAFAAPLLGAAGAVVARQRRWAIRFGLAFCCAVLMGVGLSVIENMATAPMFGQTEESPPQPPPPAGCVAYSGGSNSCPGG